MGLACLATSTGVPVTHINVVSNKKFNTSFSPIRYNGAKVALHSSLSSLGACSFTSSLAGVLLRPYFNSPRPVFERRNLLKVRAGKPSLGCTKRSRSRKSRARTHGFRIRMRTTAGRNVLKRRRAKGRKKLVPQTHPYSGKGS